MFAAPVACLIPLVVLLAFGRALRNPPRHARPQAFVPGLLPDDRGRA